MHFRCLLVILSLFSPAVVGCGSPTAKPPFGPAATSATMAPLAGKWVFDLEKTLAANEVVVEGEPSAKLRKTYGHADLTLEGNSAVAAGASGPEYRFFRMHKHGSATCGVAWLVDDRFKPEAVGKCYVRFEMTGDELRMRVFMREYADLDDPEVAVEPPLEGDASECVVESEKLRFPDLYVFRRGA